MPYPVLLTAYNRPKHTKKVLEALSRNILAKDSDLYAYVDGPKKDASEEDIEKNQLVTDIIKSQKCFKSVSIYISDQNRGCRDAIIYAITDMLKKFEAIIILEDDIITSPAFLTFMNKALEYYKDRPTVFSISGHSHSPSRFHVYKDYEYDVFASPRLFNNGWGTWADRWNNVDWSMSYYKDFMSHEEEKNAFSRGGDDLIQLLTDEFEKKSSAWDIQFAFHHFANHAVSIVPCISYTYNIGFDGSGTHSPKLTDGNKTYVLNQNLAPRFLVSLYFDRRIINSLHTIFVRGKRPLYKRVINRFYSLLKKPIPFFDKNKIYY